MRILLLLAALSALALPGTAGAGQGATVEVQTLAGTFSPDTLDLQAGDVVVWRNADGRAHTVTSAWDDGRTFDKVLRPGETFSVRFDAAGAYAIRCMPHSSEAAHGGHEGMVQTLRVAGPAASAQTEGSGPAFDARLVLVPIAAVLAILGLVWVRNGGAIGLPRARPTRRT